MTERLIRLEKDLNDLRRRGIGGNHPPDDLSPEFDAKLGEAILAARVTRDEIQVEHPRGYVVGLVVAVLKRAESLLTRWAPDISKGLIIGASTHVGKKIAESVDEILPTLWHRICDDLTVVIGWLASLLGV